jgi:hypothetical protein
MYWQIPAAMSALYVVRPSHRIAFPGDFTVCLHTLTPAGLNVRVMRACSSFGVLAIRYVLCLVGV